MSSPNVLYSAARRVLEAGLGADDSAFTPGTPVWTVAAVDDLFDRFVVAPDPGGRNFLDKLTDQLTGAPAATVQFTAELLYLHLLAPMDMGGPSKRSLLSGTLAISSTPVSIPPELDAALDNGFARVGTAYLTQRDRQLRFLVRLVRTWKGLPREQQRELLVDPWLFRGLVDTIPIESAFSQRNALLHLAFPDTFEPIVSRQHKAAILAAFGEAVPDGSGDEDRDLLSLHHKLERERGRPINFYEAGIVERWRVGGATNTDEVPQVRGWLVRGANVDGHDLVPEWLAGNYCSIAYPELGDIPEGQTRSQLAASLAEALPDLTARQRAIHAGILDRFFNQMRIGDLVVTVEGPHLYVSRVTGGVTWHGSSNKHSDRRRAVEWIAMDPPLRRDQLSDAARDKLSGQMTVSDLGPTAVEFARLAGLDDASAPLPADGEPVLLEPPAPVVLPEPTQQLAETLLIDRDWLVETIDLLRDKKQLILYGPPGTGKTYIAQELARFLSEQTGGGYRLVQFHPSYAYEDFFEGFRPQSGVTPGTITFNLEPGPFKQIVTEAAADVSRAYILVIDEINRANLAKVFGELYFLLEYRDRSIVLQYSPGEEFRLPPNVFVIGTMNTADRSIALVDAAMRRRFVWQGLFPGEAPVAGMLSAWLRRERLPMDRAELLDTLNARIADRDSAIGPSYLMTRTVGTEQGLARLWKHQILPLLEERHIGEQLDVQATYSLDALRAGPTKSGIGQAVASSIAEESGEAVQ